MITVITDAVMPASENSDSPATSATITPPSMLVNDYVVVFVRIRANETISISDAGGQSWTSETPVTGTNRAQQIFHCRFNGTWSASPNFAWTSSVGYIAWMIALRGVHPTTPKDADAVGNTYSAPSTPFDVTIASSTITTTVANCMLFAGWGSADDNTWALQTAGWNNPPSGAYWRNLAGSDSSFSVGYKIQAAAGGNEATTNRQVTNGGDVGEAQIIAFRPSYSLPRFPKPTYLVRK